MFGHDKDGKARFGSSKPEGKKQEPLSKGEPHHGGDGNIEHITKTHPGLTKPHPITGVHAFHSMHTGGGKYKSHTHHEDGTVEQRDHENVQDLRQAHEEALPHEGEGGIERDVRDGGEKFSEVLGGVGGEAEDYG